MLVCAREARNLWNARFLVSLKMGIMSCKNPYIDEHIETMDSGLMTTSKLIDLIDAERKKLTTIKDYNEGLPTTLFLLLCNDEKHDKFLTFVTGNGARYWHEASLEIVKKYQVWQ